MELSGLTAVVAALAAQHGYDGAGVRLEACTAGGNNRVFRVHAADRQWIAKWYYCDPSDPRDRLGTEYALLEYARDSGIGCVPRPIASDRARHVGLYEYVEGERPRAGEIAAGDIDQAAGFFRALNSGDRRAAAALPVASEACFSFAAHLELVERRIARLAGIAPSSALEREAAEFVARMRAGWVTLDAEARAAARAQGFALDAPLAGEERCVSPSDFGFHNALRRASGELCFIDFEYAGRDDPAKMVCDFFCQPDVPVPERHFSRFADAALTSLPGGDAAVARARLLLPAYRMKWACIMLNHFVPDAARRRSFADPESGDEGRKRAQLERARRALAHCLG